MAAALFAAAVAISSTRVTPLRELFEALIVAKALGAQEVFVDQAVAETIPEVSRLARSRRGVHGDFQGVRAGALEPRARRGARHASR